MSNTSSYEKNNPDNLKHNGITIDSEFLTQEPITIPSNGSAVSIDETGSGSKWQDFKDSFKRVNLLKLILIFQKLKSGYHHCPNSIEAPLEE